MRNTFFLLAALAALLAAPALAADFSGKWTAAIDTQVGVQNYTYDLKVEGTTVTGTAKSQNGESKIQGGAIKGDEITFVENLDFEGQAIKITYTGKIAGDEIKFTRKVADFATEDFVAKRAK
jgi:opacity protein-like surface antigen